MLTFSDKHRTEHYRILLKAQQFMKMRREGKFNGTHNKSNTNTHSDKKGNIFRQKT